MSDGRWRIKQYAPNAPGGVKVTEIPVVRNPYATDPTISSPTWPWWMHEDMNDGPCLGLVWQDGHEEYYPWSSILHAEYRPPTDKAEK